MTDLFETELDRDETLSDAKKIGTVVSYELDGRFMLHRNKDASQQANEGRILIINAHGEEPTEADGETSTMPLPDNVTLAFGVPSGHNSTVSIKVGECESEIAMVAKKRPPFALVRKIGANSEVAALPKSQKLTELINQEGGLENAAVDAKRLFQLATGSARAGHIANSLLSKLDQVRHTPDRQIYGYRMPSIVDTRGRDTYDQVAFAALNDHNVDILTIRAAGKKVKKSELIKTLDELGIRSQYDQIYDSSCRPRMPLPSENPPSRWFVLSDNLGYHHSDAYYLTRTGVGGSTEVEQVDENDEAIQEWMKYSGGESPRQNNGLNDQAEQSSSQSPTPEIRID